jgi:hypothetical protein
LHGKPAVTKFLGVADMGIVHNELEDGVEILWRLRKCKQKTARALAVPKSKIMLRLKRDLANVE